MQGVTGCLASSPIPSTATFHHPSDGEFNNINLSVLFSVLLCKNQLSRFCRALAGSQKVLPAPTEVSWDLPAHESPYPPLGVEQAP